VREAVRSLCDRLAPGGRLAVEAVGLTGQMHGAVLCDGGLEPLRAAILWSDARAAAEAARAAAAVGAERLEARTGSLATANYVLPKLLWLAAHAPQALARARRVLGVACSCPISWVIHRHVP
jgi:xylulokinase